MAEPSLAARRGAGRAAGRPPSYEAVRQRFFWACLAPALLVLAVVTGLPLIYLAVSSLTPFTLTDPAGSWNFARPARNYVQLLSDGRFLNSLWVQLKLSVFGVGLQLAIGTLFALGLNRRSRLLEALRPVFLIPMVLPPIVVAIIWKILYTPDISPLYQAAGALGLQPPAITADANLALWAIVVADTWQWFPFTLLMVLAALQLMPDELVEAAHLDGASALQATWYVTLPYLKDVLVVAALFRLVDSVKAFPLIYILTEGGPGSVTEVTNYYSYLQAFNFSYLGYSSAITVVLVVIVIAASALIFRAAEGTADA